MPADSKEFLLVEKGLLKVEGLVDDSWDEKDPVQSGYLFTKLKRFNLDLVKATFSTVESSRELTETVTAFKQSAKGSALEKACTALEDLVSDLEHSTDDALQKKGVEISDWLPEARKVLKEARGYLSAAKAAKKDQIDKDMVQVAEAH
eukprot:s9435_g1.t1